MDFPPLLVYLLAFYMMFAISGDNAAEALSAAVGSGVRTFREAIAIIAVFGILGALLQGAGVHGTLGGGILETIPSYAAFAILLTTALWGSGLLLGFIPVSSAYAIVGASVGAGIYMHTALNWPLIFLITFSWIIAPFIAFGITLGIAWYIIPPLRLKLKSPLRIYRYFSVLITVAACFDAYTFGANRIGFVTGPFSQTAAIDPTILFVVGIAGMVLGPAVVGKRFIKVLTTDVTHLDPGQGLSTTLGSSTSDYTLNLFGIPSSFDSTTFGAVVGAGSSKGLSTVRSPMVKRMIYIWILNIAISVATGYGLTHLLYTLGV